MNSTLFKISGICFSIAGFFWLSSPGEAQISPDGSTSTTVVTDGDRSVISDGDRAGNNLYHSFQDFSVVNGGEAFFDNPGDISNILSRVTGGNISQIDGLIRANGGANLFLINPSGIVFGEGGSLSLGGSFYGSTADSIIFPDGEFSATDLDNPPLLTVNAPIGLSFRDEPAPIQVQGSNLRVNPNQNLSLIGGNINISDGVRMFAPGGNINLGGIAQSGTIELNNGSFIFPATSLKSNVTLDNDVVINTVGTDGGTIALTGQVIAIAGTADTKSQLRTGIASGMGSAEAQAGNITLDGAQSIQLNDTLLVNSVFTGATGNAGNISLNSPQINASGTNIQSQLQQDGTGKSGNIDIQTNTVSFGGGSRLLTTSAGQGDAGDIIINGTDSVSVRENTVIQTTLEPTGEGQGGDITISTGEFSLIGIPTESFSLLLANTQGLGDAGNINIQASESITVDRGRLQVSAGSREVMPEGNSGELTIQAPEISLGNFSLLVASAPLNSTGEAGNISITGDSVSIAEGTFVTTLTENVADGGDLTITSDNLELTRGGAIVSSTTNAGNAGKITLNVSDNLTIDGSDPVERPTSVDPFDEEILNDLILETGLFADATETSTGQGGSITVNSPVEINLVNEGRISVSSEGIGNGGSLFLTSDDLNLDNEAVIEAFTNSGTGGNINLNIEDVVFLRENNNLISARAANDANGGNVNIDTTFVVALPNQNNDITANALSGDGGDINITAESLLGIEQRSSQPSNFTNDIDASSEFGLDGSVSITNPDVDRTRGATQLDSKVIEPQAEVAQACRAENQNQLSSLSIRGKGGIPQEPTSPFIPDTISIEGSTQVNSNFPPQPKGILTAQGYIYPARSVSIRENGDVILHQSPKPQLASRKLVKSRNCLVVQ